MQVDIYLTFTEEDFVTVYALREGKKAGGGTVYILLSDYRS